MTVVALRVDLRQKGDRGGGSADEEFLFADAYDGDKALLAELLHFQELEFAPRAAPT